MEAFFETQGFQVSPAATQATTQTVQALAW